MNMDRLMGMQNGTMMCREVRRPEIPAFNLQIGFQYIYLNTFKDLHVYQHYKRFKLVSFIWSYLNVGTQAFINTTSTFHHFYCYSLFLKFLVIP